MADPTHTIEIRNAETGESFTFDPGEALWLDMLAFSEASGLTIEEIIPKALAHFFEQLDNGVK